MAVLDCGPERRWVKSTALLCGSERKNLRRVLTYGCRRVWFKITDLRDLRLDRETMAQSGKCLPHVLNLVPGIHIKSRYGDVGLYSQNWGVEAG